MYNVDNCKGDLGYDVAIALVRRQDTKDKAPIKLTFAPLRSFSKEDLIKCDGEAIVE
jgi:hypothetical protein